MHITESTLIELNACDAQVVLFARYYPDGLELPDEGPERQAVLDNAGRQGLPIWWWLRHTNQSGIAREWYEDKALAYEEHYANGLLHDPSDGTAAIRHWYDNGVLAYEYHYTNGRLHNPPDGTAAVRGWWNSGALEYENHYRDGQFHDPMDGTAACRGWHENGALMYESHYTNGQHYEVSMLSKHEYECIECTQIFFCTTELDPEDHLCPSCKNAFGATEDDDDGSS